MPNPVPGDLHVNRALGDVSIAYVQENNRFIADRVFPVVPVQKQSDLYWTYDKGDWFRTDAQKRAPGAESVGTEWNVSQASYFAHVWALHMDIDDQLRANADSAFNLDRDATRNLTGQMLLRRDKEWISKYFGTGIWDTNITGVASGATAGQVVQWDKSGATPIEDIYAQKINMLEKTGREPNTLVVGARTWQALANSAEIIERVKYTQAGFVSEDLVARALGVDRLIIARATENTAVQNKSKTWTFSFLAGKAALLAYVPDSPSLLTPSAGYTFAWNGYTGASDQGVRIKRFRQEANAADRIEIEAAFDLKVVSTDLGVYFTTVVS